MKLPHGKKAAGFVIGALIAIFLSYRLFWHRPTVAVIRTDTVEVQSKAHGPGTVQSRVPVSVSVKITGILVKLYADQGDRVGKGQILAELDSDQLRAQKARALAAKSRAQQDLAGAQAGLLKSQADLGLSQSNYRRDSELLESGVISQAVFDTTAAALKVAESEVNVSEHAVAAAQAEVEQVAFEAHAAEAELAYTRILAPMEGLITTRNAEVGDTISPGLPIFQMVDNQIWAASWIDETKVAQLQQGQKATITLRSGRVFQGEVVRLNKEADTVTRELEVDVKFDSLPEPLVIGEETEVEIHTGEQTAPAVPLSAILRQNGATGVLVVSDGLVSFRPLSLGLHDGQQAAVLEGLKEGEMVIINPAGIRQGKHVRAEIKPSAS
jgi:HlyD family secretion protein